jgi:5-hydroxyisourate hydrolase
MPGMSIHVVDVSRGVVAAGMEVEVYAAGAGSRQRLAAGRIGATGTLADAALDRRLAAGMYEAVFHVSAYYAAHGIAQGAVPFLDIVTYRFGIADPEAHYHLPMKCTPWGYSCFRGGQ